MFWVSGVGFLPRMQVFLPNLVKIMFYFIAVSDQTFVMQVQTVSTIEAFPCRDLGRTFNSLSLFQEM